MDYTGIPEMFSEKTAKDTTKKHLNIRTINNKSFNDDNLIFTKELDLNGEVKYRAIIDHDMCKLHKNKKILQNDIDSKTKERIQKYKNHIKDLKIIISNLEKFCEEKSKNIELQEYINIISNEKSKKLIALLLKSEDELYNLKRTIGDVEIDDKKCPICMEGQRNFVIIPCGHRCCKNCGFEMFSKKMKNCHICRGEMQNSVIIYD